MGKIALQQNSVIFFGLRKQLIGLWKENVSSDLPGPDNMAKIALRNFKRFFCKASSACKKL